jgi:hypothetical protein
MADDPRVRGGRKTHPLKSKHCAGRGARRVDVGGWLVRFECACGVLYKDKEPQVRRNNEAWALTRLGVQREKA